MRLIKLGKLSRVSKKIASGKHLEIHVPYVREILPEIIAVGLTEQDWHDLESMVKNNTDCRYVVIENLDKLNFLETFFRFRVFDWERREIESFLEPLENSALLSLATLFKLIRPNMKKIKKWDENIKPKEFEKAKKLLRKGCVQQRFLKKLTWSKFIPMGAILLLLSIIIYGVISFWGIELEIAEFIFIVLTALATLLFFLSEISKRSRDDSKSSHH